MHRTLPGCKPSGTQVSEDLGDSGGRGGGSVIKISEALTRCQKSPSPRSSFPHRDPIWRWRSNSRRRSGSSSTEGQEAAAAGGARGQLLRGLTMVDASPGTMPPQPGTPATPAGGWRQQPPPWRPQPLPPLQRPAKGSEEAGDGGCRGKKEGGLRRLTEELLLRPLGWSAAGSGQGGAGGWRTLEQRRRFPQGCGEEEAELPWVGADRGEPNPGSRRRRHGPAGAHPTISRLAAGCPLSPRRRLGRSPGTSRAGDGPRGGGFLQTRSSRDDSRRGRRGRRGVCEAAAGEPIAPTRAGWEQTRPGDRVPRSGLRARTAAAGRPPAGAHQQLSRPAPHLLTPARGELRGGRRKRSRRPLLPPPPPLPEPGAPAGEGGEVVPGDFSWPPTSPEGQSEHGVGLPSGDPGL